MASMDQREERHTIAVSRLNNSVTREELLDFFSYCGEVSDISSYPDPMQAGYKRAIITFADEAGAEMGYLMDGAELCGEALMVAPVSIKQSGITVGELGERLQTFVGRKKATEKAEKERVAKAKAKAQHEDGNNIATTASRYKKQIKQMKDEEKVALWAGAALVGAAVVWSVKHVAKTRKKQQERKTRYLVGAYDHLFRHGPENNRGHG